TLWIVRRGVPMHAEKIDASSDHPLEWAELFRFSLGMYANNVIWLLILKVDQFIVRGFAGDYALGLYAVAAGLAESFRNLPSLIGSVVFPYVVQMPESERKPFLSRVAAQTLWISLVLAIVLAAAAGPLVTLLYGEEYAGAATSAGLLFIAIALLSTGDLLGYHFIAAGRPTVITAVSAASLILNVALNFALVPYLGIAGAAVASVAAYGAVSLAIAWLLRAREGYTLRDMLWPRLTVTRGAGTLPPSRSQRK
ncbi:MAG TPA: oligosaccharide flippase family protein, partial [Thermoanaerobaculia bacterium]|nr:oligosaccharide flippase family protein [Thermoanaerobaculia bacterium]